MMKRLQNLYLYCYRLTGFIFLSGLITSILWYGFSVLFFSTNQSWLVPLILSPDQERVMTHLEHMLNLEHQLTKDQIELKTTEKALYNKLLLLDKTYELRSRFKKSMLAQSRRYSKKSSSLHEITQEKNKNINELTQLASEIERKEKVLNQELKIGLITKQEALKERFVLSNLRTSLIDARARAHELNQRSIDFANAANTLNGAATHLNALHNIVKKNELDIQIVDLNIDTYSLKVTIEHLKKDINKRQLALKTMRKSPYILATKRLISVAFVPYTHLKHIKKGNPIYSCYFDMMICHQAGQVADIYKAEEYGKHPIFKSEIKGQLIRIAFNNKMDAQRKLLFLNSKPLFF